MLDCVRHDGDAAAFRHDVREALESHAGTIARPSLDTLVTSVEQFGDRMDYPGLPRNRNDGRRSHLT
jgi:hypothetical protein